jgi:hypothetical protein
LTSGIVSTGLAVNNPGVCFVTFADSLLLKSNWSVGTFDSDVEYTYEPEALVNLFPQMSKIYDEVLGLKIYAVITQGVNEYYDESLIYVSPSANHVCLNSIGLPFAQLLAIDDAVRIALRRLARTVRPVHGRTFLSFTTISIWVQQARASKCRVPSAAFEYPKRLLHL